MQTGPTGITPSCMPVGLAGDMLLIFRDAPGSSGSQVCAGPDGHDTRCLPTAGEHARKLEANNERKVG